MSHKCTSSVASYIDETLYTAMCICSLFTSDKNNQRGIDQTFEFSIESQEGLALSTLNVCSLSKLIGFTFGAARKCAGSCCWTPIGFNDGLKLASFHWWVQFEVQGRRRGISSNERTKDAGLFYVNVETKLFHLLLLFLFWRNLERVKVKIWNETILKD